MNTSKETTQRFLNMMDDPDSYSDEQIEAMMDNNICKVPDVDAEWEKFESLHFPEQKTERSSWRRKVAAVVTWILLAGFVYATSVVLGIAPNIIAPGSSADEQVVKDVQQTKPTVTKEDTIVTFDNVPLSEIISEFAKYYKKEVIYKREDAKDIRLFFQWNKAATLETNVTSLNTFEKISIEIKNNTLIIK